MARKAADARKEMKALGEAVEEDIGANVATMRCAQWAWLVMTFLHVLCFPRVYVYNILQINMCRKERLELRAELLVALQDLDGRLATSREELSRQGPCVHVHRFYPSWPSRHLIFGDVAQQITQPPRPLRRRSGASSRSTPRLPPPWCV